jgi:hypothetical protein
MNPVVNTRLCPEQAGAYLRPSFFKICMARLVTLASAWTGHFTPQLTQQGSWIWCGYGAQNEAPLGFRIKRSMCLRIYFRVALQSSRSGRSSSGGKNGSHTVIHCRLSFGCSRSC